MLEKLKLTEVWLKIALLFVFSAFYVAALSFPEQSRQFPQLLAVASLVMTAIALVTDFTRKRAVRAEISGVDDTELKVLDADDLRARKKRYYQAWAIILFSTIVGFLGGFLFSALGWVCAGKAYLLLSRLRGASLAKQLLTRRRADCDHRRMGEAALHRNGVELLCHRFSVPDGYHAILLAYYFSDGRGRGKDADTDLAERLH